MKIEKNKILFVSFMLFSMFFGAGNLIFPPFLGQNAGANAPVAMVGFIVTAVVLPVLGILVIAKFNGLENLANQVNKPFALIFTILIYLSIGPGLAIPRAASVPFELSIAPYMPEGTSFTLYMLIYSAIFFALSIWLSLTPNKLVERMGKILTPLLLILIVILFAGFIIAGETKVAAPQEAYVAAPVVTGFIDGYQTMDAIAALNFGLVIAITFRQMNVKEEDKVIKYTAVSGLIAGILLALIYVMFGYMGMKTSAVYDIQGNGAYTLRCIVKQLFGDPGAILLASIFALACITTCVGLITSCAQYFSTLTKNISYKAWVYIISIFSFIICNQGLNTILSISIPILNAIYPMAIMLILMGLTHKWIKDNKIIYPLTIGLVGVESVLYALGIPAVNEVLDFLPLYNLGMGWVVIAVVAILVSFVLGMVVKKEEVKA